MCYFGVPSQKKRKKELTVKTRHDATTAVKTRTDVILISPIHSLMAGVLETESCKPTVLHCINLVKGLIRSCGLPGHHFYTKLFQCFFPGLLGGAGDYPPKIFNFPPQGLRKHFIHASLCKKSIHLLLQKINVPSQF